MTIEELLAYFKSRQLNSKTNNLIIIGNEANRLIDGIPDTTSISFIDDDFEVDTDVAINIKIDLSKTDVKSILTYALNYLKQYKLIDEELVYSLPFNNKFDLLRFRRVLQDNNIVIQLFFYNMQDLSIEEQMLFNELYYYNNRFFSVISLVKDGFKTYFLTQDRVLDDRENYQRCEIIKPYILAKQQEQN